MFTINPVLKDQKYDRLYQWETYRVLKITDEDETYFKVFAANSGGYASGDHWRINSCVTKVVYDDRQIAFFGGSGSVYVCPIGQFRMSMYNQLNLQDYISQGAELVEHDKLFDVLKEHGIEIEYVGGKE